MKLNVTRFGNRVQQTRQIASPNGCRNGFPAKYLFIPIRYLNDLRASALLGTTEGASPAFILVIYFGAQGCADPRVI